MLKCLSPLSLRSSRLPLFFLMVFVLTLMLTSIPQPTVQAASGDLDPTFGTGGKVTTHFFDSSDMGWTSALQADGKIIVVGSTLLGNQTDVALARYNTDGSLDGTFGTGGKVTTDFSGGFDYAYAVTL